MAWEFERIATGYGLAEGPVWDGDGLLFTAIPDSTIHRYDPETETRAVWRTGTNQANGLKFGPDGYLYGCEGGARRVVRYEPDDSTAVVADEYRGTRLNRPNDLGFDGQGRLWFTDPLYGAGSKLGDDSDGLDLGHASVYRVDPVDGSWEIERATYDTGKPNGVLVSKDDTRLYVAESHYGEGNDRELRSYPIREDGSLGEYEVLHNFYPHRGIDGMCLDAEGNVIATAGWEVSGPGAMLYVFAPNGRILSTHPFPGDRPTNCAFGDDDLRTLYVTDHDGDLYRARTDRTGYLDAPDAPVY